MLDKNLIWKKKIKLKVKFNIQGNIQFSVIKISSTAVQQLFFGKFNIQWNIQYSIAKVNSTDNLTFNRIFNIQ